MANIKAVQILSSEGSFLQKRKLSSVMLKYKVYANTYRNIAPRPNAQFKCFLGALCLVILLYLSKCNFKAELFSMLFSSILQTKPPDLSLNETFLVTFYHSPRMGKKCSSKALHYG